MPEPLLQVQDLGGGYDERLIVSGITMGLASGCIGAVVGHNGAGKSTFLRVIAGVTPRMAGRVYLDDREITKLDPRERVKGGVAFVPQGNRVFGDLTVEAQLVTVARGRWSRKTAEAELGRVESSLPGLGELLLRKGRELSGGERQLVALGMGLVLRPRVLLLDEPTLGLSRERVLSVLLEIRSIVLATGAACLIVEQRVKNVLSISDRCIIMRGGAMTYNGDAREVDGAVLRDKFL